MMSKEVYYHKMEKHCRSKERAEERIYEACKELLNQLPLQNFEDGKYLDTKEYDVDVALMIKIARFNQCSFDNQIFLKIYNVDTLFELGTNLEPHEYMWLEENRKDFEKKDSLMVKLEYVDGNGEAIFIHVL